MSPAQFADALTHIGWTQHAARRQFGMQAETTRQRSQGTVPIPPEIDVWMTRMLLMWTRHPPPRV